MERKTLNKEEFGVETLDHLAPLLAPFAAETQIVGHDFHVRARDRVVGRQLGRFGRTTADVVGSGI